MNVLFAFLDVFSGSFCASKWESFHVWGNPNVVALLSRIALFLDHSNYKD